MKEALAFWRDGMASISKMKQLSQKTKIRAECLHEGKGDGRPCCIIQRLESWDKERSLTDTSGGGASHTEHWGPEGQLCSEWFQSKWHLLRDLSGHPPFLVSTHSPRPATFCIPPPRSFPSRHLSLYYFSHCSRRAEFTSNLFTAVFPASNIIPGTQ